VTTRDDQFLRAGWRSCRSYQFRDNYARSAKGIATAGELGP